MTLPTVSVIVVSRHRPKALLRCLTSLAQQDHPKIEVIVVADPAAADQVDAPVKLHPFDEANISAARNEGLRLAAGEVVAFIDDDAVAEPTWASRLAAAFHDAPVVAATGFVRGRNGISYQWQAAEVDSLGRDHPIAVGEDVSLHAGNSRRAVKTQGTNCAFRRDILLAIGGFDPAFRFYLDEADVNLRLAAKGLTAVVPDAQVHHGFAASARRRADRVPTSLHEIGASSIVFLRRHAPPGDWALGLDLLRREQRARMLGLMVAGLIEPRDVEILLRSLETGFEDGARRILATPAAIPPTNSAFLPMPRTGPRDGLVLVGRIWQRRALRNAAQLGVAAGKCVTVLRFSLTALNHHHSFDPAGFWLQTGGIFGRGNRTERTFAATTPSKRFTLETRRLSAYRPVSVPQSP